MSGHSKWANIKNKKAKVDAQRGVAFQKFSREIITAARLGGTDPAGNFRLRTAIDRAKAAGLPNDNIKRAIEKGGGAQGGDNFEEITYEGYGAGGAAIFIEAMTDNRNRTAGEIRHYFDKFGGNMGTSGCVSFMFSLKGIIVLDNEEGTIDEDKAMEDILEAGGDDFSFEDGCVEITTDPKEVENVANALRDMGYNVVSAEAEQVPSTYTTLTDEEHIKKMNLLLETLDDNDDVQNVWHNWDMD